MGSDGSLFILSVFSIVEIYSPSGSLEYSWLPDLAGYTLQELALLGYLNIFSSFRIRLDEAHNYVYILCTKTDQIQIFTRDGTLINLLASAGYGAGEILGPIDLAINASGYSYVVEYSGNRIQIFAPEPEEESYLIYIILGFIAVAGAASLIAAYRMRGRKHRPRRKKKGNAEPTPPDASLQIEDIIS